MIVNKGNHTLYYRKDQMYLGVILLILVQLRKVDSFPLTLHSTFESHKLEDGEEEKLLGFKQHLVKIREPDKSLLRAIALFLGLLLAFSTTICLCVMYWCMCWSLPCPGILRIQHLSRVASDACNRLRSSSRNIVKSRHDKGPSTDPPPSYELILAHSKLHEEDLDASPPPSYAEAMNKEDGAL